MTPAAYFIPAPALLLWCLPAALLLCGAAVILFDRPGDRSETLACIALVFAILAAFAPVAVLLSSLVP